MRSKRIFEWLLFVGLCVCLTIGELWLRNALAGNTGRIVFTSTRDGNTEIYVMDADGGNQERLTNHPVDDLEPSWSPDLQKIAFSSGRGGFFQIHAMGADAKDPTKLTDGGLDARPDWSPDGQKIAYTSTPLTGRRQIVIIDTDGRNAAGLTDGDEASWSPDGTRVAFVGWDEEHHSEIHVINVNDHEIENLTPDLPNSINPTWSPDGRKIAFVSLEDEFYHIYVMKADSKSRKRLTTKRSNKGVDNLEPTWSPNGRTIAYVIVKVEDKVRTTSKIHLMTADGQYLKQLSDDHNGRDRHPDFGLAGLVAVSPASSNITIWGRLKKLAPEFR